MRHHPEARALWLASILAVSAIAGAAAGLLAWAGGMNPPTAVLTGAGAFSGTVLLLLSIIQYAFATTD